MPGYKLSIQKTDIVCLLFLCLAVLGIFYPVFYADYLYTDEATQLWFFKHNVSFQTFAPQGRYITYRLFDWLFRGIHTGHELGRARLFSLFGWMLCLPVWYFIVKTLVRRSALPPILVLLSMVYLICMPPFAIYLGWASCLEMFIACTAGLISGYFLYAGINPDGPRLAVSPVFVFLSVLTGLVSLFTYQNGFGCFFISFFIPFIAARRWTRAMGLAALVYLCIFGVYFILFKFCLSVLGIEATARGVLSTNPLGKLIFLLTRPLAASFRFTWLFQEESMAGEIVYLAILTGWLILYFTGRRPAGTRQTVGFFGALILVFILIYLPSLLVRENYPSNRTLFALNWVVFMLVAETGISRIKKYPVQRFVAALTMVVLLLSAWYNFHKQFLGPLTREYALIRDFLSRHYNRGIGTIYFIRPAENTFERKYGIVASWDEFGVPSTAKRWTPEALVKQLVFEQTGDRAMAEKLLVRTWPDEASYRESDAAAGPGILLIDAGALILAAGK